MTEDDFDDVIETLLETPPGAERHRLMAGLDDAVRARVTELSELDDLVHASAKGAPPLESDPVAAMLGLVHDPSFRLDPTVFARHCSRKKLRPSMLAERLQARGWAVDAGDVFRWQSSVASDVSPALVRVLAEELRTSPESLVAPVAGQTALDRVIDRVTSTGTFKELVTRFAQAESIPLGMAQATLRTRMLATVRRGDEPEPQQMLDALEALVSALEAR